MTCALAVGLTASNDFFSLRYKIGVRVKEDDSGYVICTKCEGSIASGISHNSTIVSVDVSEPYAVTEFVEHGVGKRGH